MALNEHQKRGREGTRTTEAPKRKRRRTSFELDCAVNPLIPILKRPKERSNQTESTIYDLPDSRKSYKVLCGCGCQKVVRVTLRTQKLHLNGQGPLWLRHGSGRSASIGSEAEGGLGVIGPRGYDNKAESGDDTDHSPEPVHSWDNVEENEFNGRVGDAAHGAREEASIPSRRIYENLLEGADDDDFCHRPGEGV
jgi:hypothetical protein